MPRVLVITDNERVQKLFEALEREGALQLRSVGNLLQSEAEVSQFAPDYTFVQSRISGLSGEIVLRHLKKAMPADARTVLLAVDSDDAQQARKQGALCLELSESDDALAEGIAGVLKGVPPPPPKKSTGRGGTKKGTAAQQPEGKERPMAEESAPKVPAEKTPSEGAARPGAGEAPSIEEPVPEEPVQEEPVQEMPVQEMPVQEMPVQEMPGAPQPSGAGPATEEPREEALEAADEEALEAADRTVPAEAPPRTERVASFEEAMRRAAEKGASAPGPVEKRVQLTPGGAGAVTADEKPPEPELPGQQPIEEPEIPEPVPQAVAKLEKPAGRPWIMILLLALVAAPLAYLLISKKTPAPPRPTQAPARPAAAPPAQPAAKAAPVRPEGSRPAPAIPAAPATKPAPPKPSPPASGPAGQPAPKRGLEALPPFLSGVGKDVFYSKSHPGWERYLGARAEYKLYKEGNVYRAIQVIALSGQTVPDEIFRKVLIEFGGVDGYMLQSKEQKQHYVVEHGITNANVELTIYRKISDQRMKAFVLFYR